MTGAGTFAGLFGNADLILMDISLPVMNGWEVTRLLKSNQLTRHIPIIALTAHALVTIAKELLKQAAMITIRNR